MPAKESTTTKEQKKTSQFSLKEFRQNILEIKALLQNNKDANAIDLIQQLQENGDINQELTDVFTKNYFRATVYGLVIDAYNGNNEDRAYNPNDIHKEITRLGLVFPAGAYHLLIQYLDNKNKSGIYELSQKLKLPDKKIDSMSRLALWLKYNNKKHIETINRNFWKVEVNRPTVKTKVRNVGKEVKRIAEKVYQEYIMSRLLNSNMGDYISHFDVSKDAKGFNFISAMVFEQFHHLRYERISNQKLYKQEKSHVGTTNVPIEDRKTYSVGIHVGDKIKKVLIPATALDTLKPNEFAGYLRHLCDVDGGFDRGYTIYDPDNKKIKKALKRAASGKEKVQEFSDQFTDPDDITAVDIRIVLTKNDTQTAHGTLSDKRIETFGRTPVVLAFDVNENGDLRPTVRTKHRHPITDGDIAKDETTAMLDKIMNNKGDYGLTDTEDDEDSLKANKLNFEDDFKVTAIETESVSQGNINGVSKIRETLGARNEHGLFAYYKEKFGIKISIHVLLQLATMMTLNVQHSHFLEESNGLLAPAISVLPKQIADNIKNYNQKGHIKENDLSSLALMINLLQEERDGVKNLKGIVRSMATMPGPRTSRKIFSEVGLKLHNEITSTFMESVLVSMVVASQAKDVKRSENSNQTLFTTANAEPYIKNGVIGFCDVDEDNIRVTARKPKSENSTELLNSADLEKKMNLNLQKLLKYLTDAAKNDNSENGQKFKNYITNISA